MTDPARDLPTLTLELVDARSVGVDIAAGTAPEAMLRCLEVLHRLAVEPGKVRLIIAGDFVESVRKRTDEGPASDSFDLSRGSGMVAGKTMWQDDGTIDVLLPWWFFNVELDDEHASTAAHLAVRTATHEAQHVAMRQNTQGYVHPDEQAWRDRNFTSAADSILDEYRAEVGAVALFEDEESPWSPTAILDALSLSLAAVVADYQAHLDVERLAFEVGEACVVAWKALAYVAAVDVHAPNRSPITPEVENDPLWRRLASESWPSFRAALQDSPSGLEVMSAAEIEAKVNHLARVLNDWLTDLGFTWTDERFLIKPWYFEDVDFVAAVETRAKRPETSAMVDD